MTPSSSSLVQRVGAARVVTLDWPEQRNALGPAQARAVGEALAEASTDGDAAAVVLTGRGAFCAGGDLAAIAEIAAQGPDAVRNTVYTCFQGMMRALLDVPVPVIAAVDGPAVGLGMDLVLACDVRLVGTSGWLRQGWGALGLIPGTGGELLLRRLNPTSIWHLLADASKIDGPGASRLGIGTAVDGSAIDAAVALAERYGDMPRSALEGYVRLHRAELRAAMDEHLPRCLDVQVELICSDEFRARAAKLLSRE